jgi:hypothetical protein
MSNLRQKSIDTRLAPIPVPDSVPQPVADIVLDVWPPYPTPGIDEVRWKPVEEVPRERR